MCLYTVDPKPKRRSGVGYKLLLDEHGEVATGLIRGHNQSLEPNVWVEDSNKSGTLARSELRDYPTGFHIFEHLENAKVWGRRCGWLKHSNCSVRRVRFSGVVATGKQRTLSPQGCRLHKVVVARRIMLLPGRPLKRGG